jgi:hypothetical protein
VVDNHGWQWAKAVVEQSMRMLIGALRRNMSEDLAAADLVETIRALFRSAKGEWVTRGQVHKLCTRKVNDFRKIDQALDHLEKCGDIDPVEYWGPGQPTKRWKWRGGK